MMTHSHRFDRPGDGFEVVRTPRAADAMGHALRSIYGQNDLPADMLALLHRIDRAH